ncbi:Metal-dependent hydrolase, endonuclease/exonuclease/phosphatase family [Roseomonas rosea]|uniref:Metal-dependent hydrolase, endonuclease/exonuclease/phosphatase family n=1 Tax=Muricoccus roseus TaxID=198092 RepID=A0A1M6KSJ5_9PROT|nr:endonuclease/exonuclease/phosphatase family protein [Roseomonas rosea]SHJ61860.1 Metal-dependent hydrolase, endonuclease/exonuclease/phosphatase family [Roseomonas rosea]
MGEAVRVATYNVHRGRGPAGRFRPERIAQVIAEIRPDLITLQEAQHYLRPGKPMFDAPWLEKSADLRPLSVTGRPDEQGWRSNVLLLRPHATLLSPPRGLRLGGWEPRGAILAELDLGGGPFRLAAAHLSLGAATRRRQGQALLRALGTGPPLPTLLMGDLNEWRPGASVLGLLEPVFGAPAHPPTFPSFRPLLALDRILGLPHGLVRSVWVHDTPASRRASDHLPLVAEIDTGLLGRGMAGGGEGAALSEPHSPRA